MGYIDRIANPPEPTPAQQDRESRPLTGVRLFGHLVATYGWRLVGLNVLLLVTCLPVVTIPIALTAASRVLDSMAARRMTFVWRDYWAAWRDCWKRALAVAGPYCLAMVLAVVAVVFYGASPIPGAVVFGGVCAVVALWGFVGGVYLFPMVEGTRLGARQVWNNALRLVPLRFWPNLATLAFDALVLAVGTLLLPWTAFVMPLFGLSLIGLAGAVAAREGLDRYVLRAR